MPELTAEAGLTDEEIGAELDGWCSPTGRKLSDAATAKAVRVTEERIRVSVEDTLLRINGAIQVLEEELSKDGQTSDEGDEKPNSKTKNAG